MSLFSRTPIIIIGAQKAGTSSLFRALSKHSAITPCRIKEPQFFALKEDVIDRNLENYAAQFSDSGRFILEASTFYLTSPKAPRLVSDILPEARLICLVRDPVDRAYSGYWHMRKKIPRRDRRSFGSIVKALSAQRHGSLLERERRSVRSAEEQGDVDSSYLVEGYNKRRGAAFLPDGEFQDPMWCYKHFSISRYSVFIDRWRRYNDNVHVLVMERLINSPRLTLVKVIKMLGLEYEEGVSLGHYNPTTVPRGARSRQVLELAAEDSSRGKVLRGITSMCHGILYTSKPSLSAGMARAAANVLKPEYKYWRRKCSNIEKYWNRVDLVS